MLRASSRIDYHAQIRVLTGLLAAVMIANTAAAGKQILSSTMQRTALIELCSSEGCSNCPSAGRWLSRLKHDLRLLRDIVPVTLHEDYWNYLGGRNRFAQTRNLRRQGDYQRHYQPRTVTPQEP